MVQIPPGTRTLMHNGLQATSIAIGSYAAVCRSMAAMLESRPIRASLNLSIRRLEAMRADLDQRLRSDNQDALFVALNVAHAGLLSLTASVGEMRQIVAALQPREQPLQGWFIDDASDAVSSA